MALNFPASSESPFLGPNGVVYTWNTDGYWEAAPTGNDYLKLDASNGPVTGPLTFEGQTTHGKGVRVSGTTQRSTGSDQYLGIELFPVVSDNRSTLTVAQATADLNNKEVITVNQYAAGKLTNIDNTKLAYLRAFLAPSGVETNITDSSTLIRVCGFESAISNAVAGKFWSNYHSGAAPNYFAGGVQFDTAAGTSAIDRYEEGTFDAEFVNVGSSNITYTRKTGNYTIVGNLCTVSYFIAWSLSGGDTTALQLPLPVLSYNDNDNYRAGASLGFCKGITFTDQLVITVGGNRAAASVWHLKSGGGTPAKITFNDLGGVGELQTTLTYQIQ